MMRRMMRMVPIMGLNLLTGSARALVKSVAVHRSRQHLGLSGEQYRKSRAFTQIAWIDPQFTANSPDERPDDPHSQSFAGGWIKSFRQRTALVCDGQCVAIYRIWFQFDRDPAGPVFGCVGDHFIGDEAERNGGDDRQRDFHSL